MSCTNLELNRTWAAAKPILTTKSQHSGSVKSAPTSVPRPCGESGEKVPGNIASGEIDTGCLVERGSDADAGVRRGVG